MKALLGRCPKPRPLSFGESGAKNFIVSRISMRLESPILGLPQNAVLRQMGQGLKALAGCGAVPHDLEKENKNVYHTHTE